MRYLVRETVEEYVLAGDESEALALFEPEDAHAWRTLEAELAPFPRGQLAVGSTETSS